MTFTDSQQIVILENWKKKEKIMGISFDGKFVVFWLRKF
jgi:hypothetical protein